LVAELQRADQQRAEREPDHVDGHAQGGNIYNMTSPQGIVNSNGGYYILEQGEATNMAPICRTHGKSDSWLFDASARLEHMNMTQQTTNQSPVQMGSKYDLWDNAVDLAQRYLHARRPNQHHSDVLGGRQLRVHATI
jgi:hypothetical protein